MIRVIKSRRMRWTGYASRIGEERNAYTIVVEKPKRKRPLGNPRHKWEEILEWS
jgi:hypothetical protein